MKGFAAILFLCLASLGAANVETWHASGPSMLPAYPVERAPVQVMTASDPFAWLSVQVGAVVFVRWHGALVHHRIVKLMRPGVYWTKGDNNPLPDSFYCTRENFAAIEINPHPKANR